MVLNISNQSLPLQNNPLKDLYILKLAQNELSHMAYTSALPNQMEFCNDKPEK